MMDCDKSETANLQQEFEWVLHQEIHKGLDQIHQILVVSVAAGGRVAGGVGAAEMGLQECARRFPVQLYGHDNSSKQDKFVLSIPADQLKCVVTLTGDSITHADINFKVTRQNSATMVRTTIHNEYPWKLQQVQDAANHLQQAIYHIDDVGKNYKFKSSDEVLHILGNILGSLQRGRTSLIVPRKKTMDDLIKSRNMVSGGRVRLLSVGQFTLRCRSRWRPTCRRIWPSASTSRATS
uniref:Protein rogdi n=1 Tax=Dendroctonus ponderosae TaxID=77166 RepID=J3JTH4_DENPD|nr:unknown [Dendroctonus ponderosae]